MDTLMIILPQRSQLLADMIVNKNSDMMYAGVVSGNNTGVVWADDISNPAFCVVWSEHLGGFHFMGDSYSQVCKPELLEFINNTIIPFLTDKGISYCEFSCDSREWIPFIMDVLSAYKINNGKQFVYKLPDKKNINRAIPCPSGYDIFEISAPFVSDNLMSLDNHETIIDDIEKTWESMDRFIKLGKGYTAIQDNRVCGFTTTHFRYKDVYCIGTETFEPHKQKGLSSFLSMSLISEIVNQGASVWWDCMKDNIASQRTAAKVGLSFDHEYDIFWFDIS